MYSLALTVIKTVLDQLPLPFKTTGTEGESGEEVVIDVNVTIKHRLRKGNTTALERGLAMTASDEVENALLNPNVDTSSGSFQVCITIDDREAYKDLSLKLGVLASEFQERVNKLLAGDDDDTVINSGVTVMGPKQETVIVDVRVDDTP